MSSLYTPPAPHEPRRSEEARADRRRRPAVRAAGTAPRPAADRGAPPARDVHDDPLAAVPAAKRHYVPAADWDEARKLLAAQLPDASTTERFAILPTFAFEGGFAWTRDDQGRRVAFAGLTQDAIDAVKGIDARRRRQLGVDFVTTIGTPLDLRRVHVMPMYRAYFDRLFDAQARAAAPPPGTAGRRLQGYEVPAGIGHAGAAAALTDTLFRHGTDKGAEIVQRAINQTIGNLRIAIAPLAVDRVLGSVSMRAYTALNASPRSGLDVQRSIKSLRDDDRGEGGDPDRSQYFLELATRPGL